MRLPRVLQVFNRYLEYGGEERVVSSLPGWLDGVAELETCWFDSREWKQADAPAVWRQPYLMERNPAALARLRAHHERFKPDVWMVSNVIPVASLAVYELAMQLKVPMMQYIHNFRPFSVSGTCWANGRIEAAGLHGDYGPEVRAGAWQGSRVKSFLLARAWRRMQRRGWLRAVTAWLAISEFMKERFAEAGVARGDLFAVPHPWVSSKSVSQGDDGSFLFLGRLHETKGVRPLLQAWHELQATFGAAAPLLQVAGTGPLAAEVEAAAAQNPRIRYVGLVEGAAKTELLSRCRALLAPALWWEPLGLVAYEAYEFAKPVLAARSGGLVETVIDGETGFLHEPGKVAQIVQQVILLQNDGARAAEMGSAGRRWLAEHASLSQWQERMRSAINHALESHAAALSL